MDIHDFAPGAFLRPFVKTYKIIESSHERINRVLPQTAIAIAFRFKGQVNYLEDGSKNQLPAAVISGLRRSVRLINYQEDAATLIVIFRETGAAAFFKEPMHELFEESVSLNNFIDPDTVRMIEARLSEASDHLQRIAIVEQFLLSRLIVPKTDPLVAAAVHTIQTARGIIKAKVLADKLYISQDAFEKRFRKTVGATPKQFASIVRMNAIILNKQNGQSVSDAAFDGDYYDQPHFNRYFKVFTGQTPAEFFKAPSFW